jgi:hypothetical protein
VKFAAPEKLAQRLKIFNEIETLEKIRRTPCGASARTARGMGMN